MVSDSLIRVARTDEIPLGRAKLVLLPNGEEIALFNIGGTYFALNNTCPHLGGPLVEGEIENNCVTCPWHGWQFELKTGTCINCPGDDATVYSVVVRDGEIFLDTASS
jgi:nitrite reductase (NADH) small subunit